MWQKVQLSVQPTWLETQSAPERPTSGMNTVSASAPWEKRISHLITPSALCWRSTTSGRRSTNRSARAARVSLAMLVMAAKSVTPRPCTQRQTKPWRIFVASGLAARRTMRTKHQATPAKQSRLRDRWARVQSGRSIPAPRGAGQGFLAGLDFGIHVAVAVAGNPAQDPAADVKSALEHAARRMRELHAAQMEEIEGRLQKLNHRTAERGGPVQDDLRDRRERTSSRQAKK